PNPSKVHGVGGTSATLTTTSGCPVSTAESTAKAVASSAKGTSSVARSTGRPPAGTSDTSSRGPLRRRVSMLLGVQLPARRLSRRAAIPAPPDRENQEEPGDHRDRSQQDEARADHDDQRDQHRRRDRRHGDHLELMAPDPAEQALVLLGRNLLCVPGAVTAVTDPALTVGHALRLAALAFDRDGRLRHRSHIVRRISTGTAISSIETTCDRCYFRYAARRAACRQSTRQGGRAWLRQSSRNASS